MPDLPPADPRDVIDAMAHALRHRRDGKRIQDHAAIAGHAAAEHMLDALRRSGFIILRAPPAPAGPLGMRSSHASAGPWVAPPNTGRACLLMRLTAIDLRLLAMPIGIARSHARAGIHQLSC